MHSSNSSDFSTVKVLRYTVYNGSLNDMSVENKVEKGFPY